MTRRLLPMSVLLSVLIALCGAGTSPELTPQQRALVFGKPRSVSVRKHVARIHLEQLLVSPEPIPLPGGFEVPYELSHKVPTIPVMVGTAQVATLIDTGDDAYAWEVRSEDLKGAVLAYPPSPADAVLNGARSSQTYVSTLGSTVRPGPLAIEQVVVGINDALPVPDFGVDRSAGSKARRSAWTSSK